MCRKRPLLRSEMGRPAVDRVARSSFSASFSCCQSPASTPGGGELRPIRTINGSRPAGGGVVLRSANLRGRFGRVLVAPDVTLFTPEPSNRSLALSGEVVERGSPINKFKNFRKNSRFKFRISLQHLPPVHRNHRPSNVPGQLGAQENDHVGDILRVPQPSQHGFLPRLIDDL